jgi:hypothetical protein
MPNRSSIVDGFYTGVAVGAVIATVQNCCFPFWGGEVRYGIAYGFWCLVCGAVGFAVIAIRKLIRGKDG